MELKYHMDEVGLNTEGFNHGDFTIVTQLDDEYGMGYKSSSLLISSVVGSAGLTLKMLLRKMRKKYDDISMNVEFERNPEQRKRIEVIEINFVIKSNDIEDSLKEELIESIHSHSPIIQSVCKNIDVRLTMEIQSGDGA
ncbi:OsmC family protein [Oceanobacillus neutriphilus]|uniref:OsmC-like protein n=1 Tax=Oceanobacillus neutriphilus TaxID=531815 RepID=A0ABQ2P1M6_9BACI|nr:OsmC family protein [Oceanobacillus neutriphilus]GGP15816.1 hypothetical protein GCM10011346_45260 [Oceanobacillus neutriphilus]